MRSSPFDFRWGWRRKVHKTEYFHLLVLTDCQFCFFGLLNLHSISIATNRKKKRFGFVTWSMLCDPGRWNIGDVPLSLSPLICVHIIYKLKQQTINLTPQKINHSPIMIRCLSTRRHVNTPIHSSSSDDRLCLEKERFGTPTFPGMTSMPCPPSSNQCSPRHNSKKALSSPCAQQRNHRIAPFFVIRSAKRTVAAICQHHANHSYTLFCPRPLSPGQQPSLTLGARILYKLGNVILRDGKSGEVELWNGKTIVFHRESNTSLLELQRLNHLPISNCSKPEKKSRALFDDKLTVCAGHLLDRMVQLELWSVTRNESTTRARKLRLCPL